VTLVCGEHLRLYIGLCFWPHEKANTDTFLEANYIPAEKLIVYTKKQQLPSKLITNMNNDLYYCTDLCYQYLQLFIDFAPGLSTDYEVQ
jgi:hypothetical protein